MSVESRNTLKSYFETGDYPTAAEFINLIDSFFHKTEDTIPGTESSTGDFIKDEIIDDEITLTHDLNTLTPTFVLFDNNGVEVWKDNYKLQRHATDPLNKVVLTLFEVIAGTWNYKLTK